MTITEKCKLKAAKSLSQWGQDEIIELAELRRYYAKLLSEFSSVSGINLNSSWLNH